MTQTRRTVLFLGISISMSILVVLLMAHTGKQDFPSEWFAMALRDERMAQSAMIGKPMPELKLTDWRNADGLRPEDLKGKILLLDFWGTFCTPCIAAFPENNAIYAKY